VLRLLDGNGARGWDSFQVTKRKRFARQRLPTGWKYVVAMCERRPFCKRPFPLLTAGGLIGVR